MMKKRSSELFAVAFIMLTALLTMTVCTKSSPLYPINDWVDANTYLTIGRAMLHGKVPYRDLYEQKGPILYFVHAAAAAVSDSSFFGVFLVETAACAGFLFASYRVLREVCGRGALILLPVISLTVYTSGAFCHGDSAEELCLPLIASAFCALFPALCSRRELSSAQWFMYGAAAAAVLWTKLNLTGTFAAFFAAALFLNLAYGDRSELLRRIISAALGALTVTLPVVLYFAINGALGDMLEVYFADNLLRYADSSSLSEKLLDGVKFTFAFLRVPAALTLIGAAVMLMRKDLRELLLFVFLLSVTFFSLFAGHLSYRYYPFPLAAFVPVSAAITIGFLSEMIKLRTGSFILPLSMFSAVSCTLLCAKLSPNAYLMKYGKSETPQYKFAEIMALDDSATLLNYGFIDGGFYLASGRIPELRYFCRNNMSVPEMVSEQERYVRERAVDFIVTRSSSAAPESPPEGYVLVSEAEFPYYEKYFYYRLYKIELGIRNSEFGIIVSPAGTD